MRVAVVAKKTTYRRFVVEEHDPRIARLLKQHDPSVGRLRSAHEAHEQTVCEVDEALEKLGAELVYRGGSGGRIPPRTELVVTVGGDGTLLAASHQIGAGVPLIGINSAPVHSVGFFCGGKKGSVYRTLRKAMRGTLPKSDLARMRVDLNGKLLHARVLNEALFCHVSPAATSRYIVRVTKPDGTFVEEDQRSSGLWIGPAAGSTAAQRSAGGNVLPLTSRRIQFVVREPYRPIGKRVHVTVGLLRDGGVLMIHSKIRDGNVFFDGHRRVHAVTLGDVLTMSRSRESLTVLGLASKRRE